MSKTAEKVKDVNEINFKKEYREILLENKKHEQAKKEISKMINRKSIYIASYFFVVAKKLGNFQKLNNVRFIKNATLKLFDKNINLGVKEETFVYKINETISDKNFANDTVDNSLNFKEKNTLNIQNKLQNEYRNFLKIQNLSINANLKSVSDVLKNNIKPISVIFSQKDKYSIQRTENIVNVLSKLGYLCFWVIEEDKKNFKFEKISESIFKTNDELLVLSSLKVEFILVYCNDISQKVFLNNHDNKMVWYDIVSNNVKNANKDYFSKEIHKELIHKSNIVTSDAVKNIDNYKSKLDFTNDIFYFENGKLDCEMFNNILSNSRRPMESYKLFGRYDNSNHISVLTTTFYDFNGYNYYSGGAERYLVDLNELCTKLGVQMDIYQAANYPWFRKYKNINVIASNFNSKPFLYMDKDYVNECFAYKNLNRSQLNIFSAFNEVLPNSIHPNIGISHGIFWDNTHSHSYNFAERFMMPIESAEALDMLVSVDTNTINWFQTIDYTYSNKMAYIPNYVDRDIFKPAKNKKDDEIVILYPRRLYYPRGFYLLLNIIDEILGKHKNVKIWFVGRGFDDDTKHLKAKMKKWKDKVMWSELDPEEMPQAYQKADISLVPTLHSEGTSLSCLEAMATGNIVVSTRVGGLPDLVLNNYNGFLIEPNEQSLLSTLNYIIENIYNLKNIRKNAIDVAKTFDKKNWDEKWINILKDKVKSNNSISLNNAYVISLDKKEDIKDPKVNQLILKQLKNNNVIFVHHKNYSKEELASNSMYRFQLINSFEGMDFDNRIVLNK